jgi:hypothetical protein
LVKDTHRCRAWRGPGREPDQRTASPVQGALEMAGCAILPPDGPRIRSPRSK